jgi:hypothetical protein
MSKHEELETGLVTIFVAPTANDKICRNKHKLPTEIEEQQV